MLPPSWNSEVQKAVEETANRENEKRKTAEAVQGTAIATALISIKKQFGAYNQKYERAEQRRKWFDIFTALFVFATAAFTGLSWWVFSSQLGEMQKVYGPVSEQATAATSAAKTARDALTKAQRAFVFEKDIFYGPITKDGKKIWRGAFRWENSGLTPTKNATIIFGCMAFPGFPSIADPYVLVAKLPGDMSHVSRNFPPKDIGVGGECEFVNDELLKAKNRESTEYSIAQVTYTDIFDITHVTRFCEIAYNIEGDVAAFGPIIVTGAPCVRYNCADEECKKEDDEPNFPLERLKEGVPSAR